MTEPLHPGLVFLHRASARLRLVEAGEIEIDAAISGLVEPARAQFPLYCACERDIVARWERDYPPIRRRQTYPRRAA